MTDMWTPDAVDRLNEYLAGMRRGLSTDADVNSDEVIEDLRAHVRSELRDAKSPVNVDALEAVLSSLGPVEEPAPPTHTFLAEWGPALVVFALFAAGVLLFSYGPYLLILSAIAARTVLARDGRAGSSGPKAWLILPPLVLLGAAIAGALLVAPVFPAAEVLVRRAGGTATGAALTSLGVVVGIWWILLAGLIAAGRRGVSWLVQPLPIRPTRIARWLAITGALVAAGAVSISVFML